MAIQQATQVEAHQREPGPGQYSRLLKKTPTRESKAQDNTASYQSRGPPEGTRPRTIQLAIKVEAHQRSQDQDNTAGYKK